MARVVQVLSVGYDRNLMLSRSLLCCAIQAMRSRRRIRAIKPWPWLRAGCGDLLLICHTVLDNEKRALISAVRKQRHLIPILCMSESDFLPDPLEGATTVSNAPAELLAAIHAAAKKTMRSLP